MSDPLPLAAASVRLRRQPGRPRTRLERPPAPRVEVASVASIAPRLLDAARAALYLSISDDAVRNLTARGILRRVRLPGAGDQDLRRVLFDVRDLDALIDAMKDAAR